MTGAELGRPEDQRLLAGFFEAIAAHSTRFVSDIAAAWKDMSAAIDSVRQAYDFIEFVDFPQDRLGALDALFRDHAQHFLFAPVQALQQRRPIAHLLNAIQEFESSAGDEIRRAPRMVQISRADLMQVLGDRADSPLYARWRGLQHSPRPVLLRDCIEDHAHALMLARAELDGAAMLLLAQASIHVTGLWKAFRRSALTSLASGDAPELDLSSERQWWMEVSRRYYERGAQVLSRYNAWAESFPRGLARSILRKPSPATARRRAGAAAQWQKFATYWARQHRAVQAVLDLELQFASVGRTAAEEIAVAMKAVDSERAELTEELRTAVEWLQQWPEIASPSAFPAPGARLAAAEERTSMLLRAIGGVARQKLPATIETVQPRNGMPGVRKPWRELAPEKVFVESLDHVAAPVLLDGFREAETAHRAAVRQIERAREVVSFGFETASTTRNREFAEEAVRNARALLTFQQGSLPDTHLVVQHSSVRAASTALLEVHTGLEKSRVGFFAYMTGQRGRAAYDTAAEISGQALRAMARHTWSTTRYGSRWFLLKIGWISEPPPRLESVVRRPHLSDTLDVDLRARDLPMIYHRLFRLAPVEDARFLVGRDAELAGLAEAVNRWECGKSAAVMIMGARGSGKTSLLNCAATSVFGQYEVINEHFSQRLTTCAEMDDFLRNTLRVQHEGDLIAVLGSAPRIVILEEFERTFLRVMNGFDALRRLLDIMYATARSTLWVFSTNETAYRYLDVVVGLSEHFSHHINAMSVRQEDLTSAILQRHNLSGLRLAFAPLPTEDPRVSRVRRALGFEQDPQKLFLDSLYAESQGIFRPAFELWQRSIERVEGGVVHMRQPLSPDYTRLLAELRLDDLFALKAVLQHGSLTEDEIGRVLEFDAAASRRQLERLRSLEILEPEACCPGMRVRPEAGRFVREALAHRNLI